jgi:iron complex transport system substrate-binding protein
MYRKAALLGPLLLSLALVVSGCRGGEHRREANAELRVVSLHDVTTEIVVALGATPLLVAMEDPVDATEELRTATAKVPRASGLESLLAAKPDLVLGLEIVRMKSPDVVASLVEHGAAVHLPALTSVNDVEALIRDVARRLKKEPEGERLLRDFSARVGAKVATSAPKRVFVFDCCDPPFTAGRRTVLSDLIARVGGKNVFGDVDAAFTHVSWEEVLARKPELIVVHAYRDGSSPEVGEKIAKLRAMESLRAVPVTVMPLRYSLGGLATGEAAALLRDAMSGGTIPAGLTVPAGAVRKTTNATSGGM